MHNSFGDVATFLSNKMHPPTTATKMTDILNTPGVCRKLKVELAITVDSMYSFVRATYNLEGDGPLALTAYDLSMHIFLPAI